MRLLLIILVTNTIWDLVLTNTVNNKSTQTDLNDDLLSSNKSNDSNESNKSEHKIENIRRSNFANLSPLTFNSDIQENIPILDNDLQSSQSSIQSKYIISLPNNQYRNDFLKKINGVYNKFYTKKEASLLDTINSHNLLYNNEMNQQPLLLQEIKQLQDYNQKLDENKMKNEYDEYLKQYISKKIALLQLRSKCSEKCQQMCQHINSKINTCGMFVTPPPCVKEERKPWNLFNEPENVPNVKQNILLQSCNQLMYKNYLKSLLSESNSRAKSKSTFDNSVIKKITPWYSDINQSYKNYVQHPIEVTVPFENKWNYLKNPFSLHNLFNTQSIKSTDTQPLPYFNKIKKIYPFLTSNWLKSTPQTNDDWIYSQNYPSDEYKYVFSPNE